MSADNGINSGLLRDFEFSAQDFERVRKLIYDRAGISLSSAKQEMVYNRLARRLRATGHKSFRDYLAMLEQGNGPEWEAFTNSLTTNLTSFFREYHHFPILAELAEKRKSAGGIMLWSAACSTGEEPYSMAMTMVDLFGTFTPPVKILATDLDTNVLATAKSGIYPMEKLSKLSPEKLKKFFVRGTGAEEGAARVRDELRSIVTFRQINLQDKTWPIRGPFDAIFCRNVMIYFDRPTQRNVLEKFAPLLRSDGLLFTGHSENFFFAADLFHLRGNTVYEPVNR
ncbi:MAG: CheR family methyltransferase [Pseudomonadota bacterium]